MGGRHTRRPGEGIEKVVDAAPVAFRLRQAGMLGDPELEQRIPDLGDADELLDRQGGGNGLEFRGCLVGMARRHQRLGGARPGGERPRILAENPAVDLEL